MGLVKTGGCQHIRVERIAAIFEQGGRKRAYLKGGAREERSRMGHDDEAGRRSLGLRATAERAGCMPAKRPPSLLPLANVTRLSGR